MLSPGVESGSIGAVSETTTVSGRLRRALPRLVIVAVVAALAIVNRSVFSTILAAVVVVGLLWDVRSWWRYVVTGERPPAKVDAQYVEPGSCSVELVASGDRQIEVIKALREVTGYGLVEAKSHVVAAPTMVVINLSEASASLVVERLQRSGATARVVTPH
jgi:ribosomal protein L7/L12